MYVEGITNYKGKGLAPSALNMGAASAIEGPNVCVARTLTEVSTGLVTPAACEAADRYEAEQEDDDCGAENRGEHRNPFDRQFRGKH